MTIPAPVQGFLEWLDSENIKPGVTLERQEHIAQTMCDLCNRRLFFSDEDTMGSAVSEKEAKQIANRICAQMLLNEPEIADALAGALEHARSLYAEGYDTPEEFVHGVVWFIREHVAERMLSGLWRQVAPAECGNGDWANLIWTVTNSVLAPKPRPLPEKKCAIRNLRRMALPEGRLRVGYRVLVDDNSGFSSFNPRWCLGEFELYADALYAAQQLVEISLSHAGIGKLSPAEVFSDYSAFGDDPFIEAFGNATEPESKFSAWRYAGRIIKERASNEMPPSANSNVQEPRIFPTERADFR